MITHNILKSSDDKESKCEWRLGLKWYSKVLQHLIGVHIKMHWLALQLHTKLTLLQWKGQWGLIDAFGNKFVSLLRAIRQ